MKGDQVKWAHIVCMSMSDLQIVNKIKKIVLHAMVGRIMLRPVQLNRSKFRSNEIVLILWCIFFFSVPLSWIIRTKINWFVFKPTLYDRRPWLFPDVTSYSWDGTALPWLSGSLHRCPLQLSHYGKRHCLSLLS